MNEPDKQKLVDSVQTLGGGASFGKAIETYVQTREGMKKGKMLLTWLPLDEIPDYDGALSYGTPSVTADLNNRL